MLKVQKTFAFTLIELLVYLSLFSFLTLLVFTFLFDTQKSVGVNSAYNEQAIRIELACDILRRDLMCASAERQDWDNQNFVFKKIMLTKNGFENITCVGWKLNKNRLMRIEGDYDFATAKWRKRVISKVATNVEILEFSLLKGDEKHSIKSVEFSLQPVRKEVVCLRNGRVV